MPAVVAGAAALVTLLGATGWAVGQTDRTAPEALTALPGVGLDAPPLVEVAPEAAADPAPTGPPSVAASDVPAVDDGWVRRVAAATGIPPVAMLAYGRAALRLRSAQPGCRLGWPTLAGIGAVESDHGRHGGGGLDGAGRTTIPILGPALDGSEGLAAIPSTADSQRWHGDPLWDHAVGPMQFIPSTWTRWGSDGNGDGVADPTNINDAAWTAARYLCASGADLSTTAWGDAILTYNEDADYVRAVHAHASTYAALARSAG
ncbi:lytic transglycosylase domain-containing protein [Janibacter sp. G56]|uniref:lytic transglycosylase domain-containing protein n=1 Tax=Janibacter sp. G56 TaxID=3418717 RepID=UPI003CFD78B8